jgi:iron-sulfur cluster repair protein YtfE (RIC family)
MKATTLLLKQHRKLEGIVDALATQTHLRNPLLLELAEELMAHIAIKKTILYPCAQRALDASLRQHHASLDRARAALRLLATPGQDARSFPERLDALKDVVHAHIVLQEETLFPAVERVTDAYSLGRLGERMEAFHAAMLRPKDPAAAKLDPTLLRSSG